MIPLQVMKQRNLMRRALRYLDDIEAIKRIFNSEEVAINIKIDDLQSSYAHTMTELVMALLNENKPIDA